MQRQIFLVIRLHIDIDERPQPAGGAKQLLQPTTGAARGAVMIEGVELTIEGRKLDGEIDARNGAAGVLINQSIGRPGLHFGGDGCEQIEVSVKILLGFGIADDCFPQDVERKTAVELAFALGSAQHLTGVFAGDESPGEVLRAQAGGSGDGCAREGSAASDAEGDPHRHRQLVLHRFQVFLQMLRHAVRRAEHRQHIHEAEELNLQRFVLHRPGHHPVVPPASVPDAGAGIREIGKQMPANGLRLGFDSGEVGGGKFNTHQQGILASIIVHSKTPRKRLGQRPLDQEMQMRYCHRRVAGNLEGTVSGQPIRRGSVMGNEFESGFPMAVPAG